MVKFRGEREIIFPERGGGRKIFFKGLHHYYTLHRLSVQIEVPSRGSISKKKLVCLYKFGMIFFRRMFSTTYLKMR